jgi:hypothetical protein
MAPLPENSLERCTRLGFTSHVFVSWPHLIEERGAEIVRALASALQDKFKSEGGGVVFSDDGLRRGEKWDEALRVKLCRSGVMIAFVVRSYFKSPYCAIEWDVADQMRAQRLPAKSTLTTIVPILLSERPPLPKQVLALNYSKDFVPLLTFSSSPASHPRWLELVSKLADEIMDVLELISQNPPDWAAQEALAMQAAGIDWQFPVAPQPAPPKMPVFVVEGAATVG